MNGSKVKNITSLLMSTHLMYQFIPFYDIQDQTHRGYNLCAYKSTNATSAYLFMHLNDMLTSLNDVSLFWMSRSSHA